MRCMGGRLLSNYHTIEFFTEAYLCYMGDFDVMWMRLWWFLRYSFISTNMKFSHIHIIMHRKGAGGVKGFQR